MKTTLAVSGMPVLVPTFLLAARPSFVPIHAYWRIDRHDATPIEFTGKWVELGVYQGEDGNWGQGRCDPAQSTECHLNDFCTWWEVYVAPPSPPTGFTPVEFGSFGFPAGYDGLSGLYYY